MTTDEIKTNEIIAEAIDKLIEKYQKKADKERAKVESAYITQYLYLWLFISAWASRCRSQEKGNARASRVGTTSRELPRFFYIYVFRVVPCMDAPNFL